VITGGSGTLSLVVGSSVAAGATTDLALNLGGFKSTDFTLTVAPVGTPTVNVDGQVGTLIVGTAGTVSFPVTTTNIDAGSYTVTVAPLPISVTIVGQVAINAIGTGTLTLSYNGSAPAGTSELTLTLDGTISNEFDLVISSAPTVTVGAQSGTLTQATAGTTITFPVTTTGIAAGSYPVTPANLPAGVTVSGQVAIAANGSGTLTLAGSATTIAGIYNTPTITINGITSSAFTITIVTGAAPTVSSAVTNAARNQIIITFNKAMSSASLGAAPSGFTVSQGGPVTAVTVSGSTITLTLATALTSEQMTAGVNVIYAPGSVTAVDGGVLAAFTRAVTHEQARTLRFPESRVTKILGVDTTFTMAARPSAGAGTITYTSSHSNVATVAAGGVVSIRAVGTTTITATIAEHEGYASATARYTLIVERLEFTEEPSGTITSGGESLEFELNAPFEHFASISLNGRTLTRTASGSNRWLLSGWPDYNGNIGEVRNGSIIITLYRDFIDSLPNGTYVMSVALARGGTGTPYANPSSTFVLNRAISARDNDGRTRGPQTGDYNNIMLWWGVLMLSVMGVVLTLTWWMVPGYRSHRYRRSLLAYGLRRRR